MNGSNYRAIADILAGDLATCGSERERLKVRGIALSLADYFVSENPRFVRSRFYDAVGIDVQPPALRLVDTTTEVADYWNHRGQ